MLQRNLSQAQPAESLVWEDLTNGVPTIAALADLCSHVLADPASDPAAVKLSGLSREAAAILQAARETGSISIRGDKNAFEPGERYLAICVELGEGRRMEFRVADRPEQTIRFMNGFRQLCRAGLVMHHLMNEFSLTAAGFELARQVQSGEVAELVQMARFP
jgi:hypothetical protein